MIESVLPSRNSRPASDRQRTPLATGSATSASRQLNSAPTADQIERDVGEWRWWLVRIGDHHDTARVEAGGGQCHVRRPRLRSGHGWRKRREPDGYLSDSNLHVQPRVDGAQLLSEKLLVVRRWPLLTGLTVHPGEVPTGHVQGVGLRDQIFNSMPIPGRVAHGPEDST